MSAATDACQRLRAERDELRAKVRAVEALADQWEDEMREFGMPSIHARGLRDVLDGTA